MWFPCAAVPPPPMRLSPPCGCPPPRAAVPPCGCPCVWLPSSCHGDQAGPAWTFLPARGLPGIFGSVALFIRFRKIWAVSSNICLPLPFSLGLECMLSGPWLGPAPWPRVPGASSFLLWGFISVFTFHGRRLPVSSALDPLSLFRAPLAQWLVLGLFSSSLSPVSSAPVSVSSRSCHQPSSGLHSGWGTRCPFVPWKPREPLLFSSPGPVSGERVQGPWSGRAAAAVALHRGPWSEPSFLDGTSSSEGPPALLLYPPHIPGLQECLALRDHHPSSGHCTDTADGIHHSLPVLEAGARGLPPGRVDAVSSPCPRVVPVHVCVLIPSSHEDPSALT